MENLNLSAKRGDTWGPSVFTISLNGLPLDLTDASIKSQFRKNANDCAVVLELNTDSGITILEPLSGKFQYDEQIIDLIPRDYKYDLQITLANETVITPFGGTFSVIQDVTR